MIESKNTSKPSAWPIRVLDEQSLPDIQALFKVAFGEEINSNLYRWKYAGGRGVSMGMHAIRSNGCQELVAHYGGIWVAIQTDEGAEHTLHTAFQGTDAMVSPSVRDVFARFGPFGRLTRTFIHEQVMPNGPAVYGFGFPNRRHLLLGERLGLYQTFEPVHEFVWHVAAAHTLPTLSSQLTIAEFDWGQPLHLKKLKDLAIAHAKVQSGCWRMVRSVESWRHRFANHPIVRYKVWLIKRAELVLLALVTRQLDETRLELMDWMLSEASDVALLPEALASIAAKNRTQWVQGWGTDVALSGWAHLMTGASRHEGCVMVVNNEMIAGRPRSEWLGRVWTTGGDTDFR